MLFQRTCVVERRAASRLPRIENWLGRYGFSNSCRVFTAEDRWWQRGFRLQLNAVYSCGHGAFIDCF